MNFNSNWKELLQPISLFIESNVTIDETVARMKQTESDVAFIRKDKKIIGYVTYESIVTQLMNGGDRQSFVIPEQNFLFVREYSQAEKIHNCHLVIGADEKNEPTGYVLMDQLQNALNTLQLKSLNDALNSAEMGIVTMDDSFHVQFMNETAERILGMEKSILQGRDYRKIIQMEASFNKVFTGQKLFGIENAFNFKKISGKFSPIYKNGKIVGIIHNFYLKDQLKEAVSEIDFVREMEEELHHIYSLSNRQIVIISPQGDILKIVGAYFRQFWGDVDQETLIGRNLKQLEKEGIFQPDIAAICAKEKKKVMLTQQGKNDQLVISTALPIIKDGRIEKMIVLSKNVTEEDTLFADGIVEQSNLANIDEQFIYRSKKMVRLMEEVKGVAPLDSTVLITGEAGVGKKIIAREIHALGARAHHPFISLNCNTIPPEQLESELFGDGMKKLGRIEKANFGTLFLDEVSKLPYSVQVKLLRVLQEREIPRSGTNVAKPINIRLIVATDSDLRQLVREGKFREDLFQRLYAVPLFIPALRERKEDIVPLALYFLNVLNKQLNTQKTIAADALELLETYDWPGNSRELRNIIERLVLITTHEQIEAKDIQRLLASVISNDEKDFLTIKKLIPLKQAVEETERQLIALALQKHETAAEAAGALGVSASTMSRRIRKINESGGADDDLLL